jgi:hypothetical protein
MATSTSRACSGLSDEIRPGYQVIRIRVKVEGDVSREELADLVR